MATTEEMNVTIALYMGGSIKEDLIYIPEHPVYFAAEGVGFKGYSGSIKFNTSWDWLMPVWGKLYNALENIKSIDVQVRKNNIAINLYYANITEAHRLIYEAIVWLNQNKGK